MTDYEILPTNNELAQRAAALIYDAAREAIAARGRFTIALTGGSSPRQTYQLLVKADAGADGLVQSVYFLRRRPLCAVQQQGLQL